jgi:hypothetical protein
METTTTQPGETQVIGTAAKETSQAFKNITLVVLSILLIGSLGYAYQLHTKQNQASLQPVVEQEEFLTAQNMLRFDHSDYSDYEKKLMAKISASGHLGEFKADLSDGYAPSLLYYDNKVVVLCEGSGKAGCYLGVYDIQTFEQLSTSTLFLLSNMAISDRYIFAIEEANDDQRSGDIIRYYKKGEAQVHELADSYLPSGRDQTYEWRVINMGIPDYDLDIQENHDRLLVGIYKPTKSQENTFIMYEDFQLP